MPAISAAMQGSFTSVRNLPMEMTMRRLTAAATALILLASAACGGGSSGGSSAGAPSAAGSPKLTLISSASTTRSAGSARFAMRMTVSANSQTVMTMSGSGVTGFQPPAAQISLRFAADQALGAVNGMTMDERVVDGAVYIQSPLFAGLTGQGKQWVKVDLGALGTGGPTDLGAGQSDPTKMLDYLRGLSSGVTRVGADDIRGVQATHYHAETSLEKALERLPESQRAGFEAMARTVGAKPIPIDVWVDGDGHIVRIRTATDLTVNGGSVQSDVQLDYFDFGVPVNVEAPPKDQVADLGGMGAALNAG
jgi:hypothetical protein